jgi:response regulator RpfG family c-di-GMP phosphodiesterase
MSAEEELLFLDEEEESEIEAREPWKVLIVDDEPEIHAITKLALSGFSFEGRPLEFISAFSGSEARKIIPYHPDTAVIFLDVVMESDDAGLELARFIRDEVRNTLARIILRTGQPGQAPERQIILDYDINDYKTKTELTSQKLFTTLVASLRSYRDLDTINANKKGLEQIVNATARIFETQSMEQFVEGVLTQMTSIMHMGKNSLYCAASGFFTNAKSDELMVVAGTGSYSDLREKIAKEHIEPEVLALLEEAARTKKSRFDVDRVVVYFLGANGSDNMIYMEGKRRLDDWERNLIELFCSNVAVAFDNIHLNEEIEDTQREVVGRMGSIAETRSKETGNHIRRVAEYCYLLAKKYGLSEEECQLIRQASPMHDIGKVGISDDILNKPGKLTPEEFSTMQRHADLGHEMLKDSKRRILQAAAIIARDHHEKYDGTGYPSGIKGEDIHIYGRIVALADVFDALGTDRVYKKAWPLDGILTYFKEQQGKHFDPVLVELFLDNQEAFIEIRDRFKDVQ